MDVKHRLLFHSNPPFIRTGLAENGKTLLKYLYKTGKYDIAHYCSQTSIADHNLSLTPWKSFGCLPTDPRIIHEINSDPGKARDVAYGSWNIDNVIKEWKPTIYLGSDDVWSFPLHACHNKPWWKYVNPILHITVDSLPVLEQAYEQALLTPNYYTWARFAMNEMKARDPRCAHVGQIYGAMDTAKFSPITDNERAELRRRFGISDTTTVFLFVGRNQLRKQFVAVLEAFAHFKREYPQADAKLHFHTSFSEKGAGWDIPKMAAYYGVKLDDVLTTYVCRSCGQWHVAPYRGEDIDCPYCGAQKSMISATITNGVRDEEMRYVYGISDACVSAFSSGGQEYHNSQSLLCGKPLASTNYSSGADFCEQPFVYPLSYSVYYEHGTNFIKATTSTKDIKNYMSKVWKSSKRDLAEWGAKGREWAVKTFSIETIGAQWERVFDAMKPVDWSSISLTVEPKNDLFPFPSDIQDENQFIHTLYREILKMEEREDGEGFRNWKSVLAAGRSRKDVYDYFIGEARKENAKNQPQSQDLWNLIDKTGRPRVLFVCKESIGDILIITSLFRSLSEQHPSADIYFMCDARYHDLISGNPYIYKILPFIPQLEHEMVAMGSGGKPEDAFFDHVYYPCLQTQKILSYLSQPSPAFDMTYAQPSS